MHAMHGVANVNEVHSETLSLVDRIALAITKRVGTMGCALIFALLALVSLPGALASRDAIVIVQWVSQTFLQLVLLSVIMVGQDLASRHGELRAENDYLVNVKAEEGVRRLDNKLDAIMHVMTDEGVKVKP
jgi:uncharacterized membrane protein